MASPRKTMDEEGAPSLGLERNNRRKKMSKEFVRPTSFYRRDPPFCAFPIPTFSEELEEDSESNEGEDEKPPRTNGEPKAKKSDPGTPTSLRQFPTRRSSRGNLFGKVGMSNAGPSRSLSFNTTRDKIRVHDLRGPPKSPTLAPTRSQSPQLPHPSSPLAVGPALNRRSLGPVDSKLVVLGSPCVGKSAIVVRILTGRFIWEYDPTLEAVYRHHTTVDDDPATIEILDTAGITDDGQVNEGYVRWGDGFVIVYSLTDRSSFLAVPEIHASIASLKHTPNFPCILLGNKSDLVHLSTVGEKEASTLASDLGVAFFSASACEGSPSLWEAFSELHRDVIRRIRMSRSRRRSSAKVVMEGFYKMFSR